MELHLQMNPFNSEITLRFFLNLSTETLYFTSLMQACITELLTSHLLKGKLVAL